MSNAELIEALQRAEGSETLRSVYLGMLNAEQRCKQAADALSAYEWRDIAGFTYETSTLGVGERMLFLVPPYGISTGHFDGERIRLHSVLNQSAQPTHYMNIPNQ